ncbi:MAG: thiamine biosynthesis protein ThiS [Bacteroidetes bacterium QH_2_63_10]|nr:MAG: thiamine biosynthesis protein ThiS [Bacteroidetes bacterium QH_2_63_10]
MSPATDEQITVTVNGDERTVPDGYPLTDVLRDLEIDPEERSGVAVAINESVIRQQDWDGVPLSEDDTVEVIQAQQGG